VQTEASITINAPAEKVFAFLSDIRRQPEWVGAVQEVTDVSEGPVGFRLHLALMGQTARARQEITRFEPNREIVQSTTSGPIPATISIFLTDQGDSTLVRNVTETDLSSLSRLLRPIATRTIRQQLDNDLQTLKRILES
jgi:carbon monoxide dehydrogenase subunit G